MIVELSRAEKRWLRIWNQRERDAGMRMRMLIVLHLARGAPVLAVAENLHVARSTVYRVMERFGTWGWVGLADRREDNRPAGIDESFLLKLREAVGGSPQDYGWSRPTWTQELLCEVLAQQTGLRVSQPTMSRCLKAIGARLGRPRAVVACPWPAPRKNRHARSLRRLIGDLPPDEIALYADEVDIHLNPKIGHDWMLPGQQKRVLTPGQNVKRYVAGALNARTGRMHWVTATHKRSGLFIDLLRQLARVYAAMRVVHLIVDNYGIHSSRQTQLALAGLPRVRLHFLPPYSPDLNPIERVWLDLHAEVTRNHRCPTIDELMNEVAHYLNYRNRQRSRRNTRNVA
jgi:transposase